MKSNLLLFIAALSIAVISCSPKEEKKPLIGKKDLKLSSKIMTPEVLWSFGRISDPQVSPDKKTVLFGITYYDIEQNKGNRELYTIPVEGGDMKQLTRTPKSEFNAVWRPDGKKIGFISTESGEAQIYEINPDGSGKRQISKVEGGITGFKYSPDQKMIAFTAEVKIPEPDLDPLYEGLPLAQGKVINRMMFRHWDTWIETYSHLFIADYNGSELTNIKDIMVNESWDVPMKPFWGMEQVSWHPDSRSLAYACKKKDGLSFATSTNSDIYIYNLDQGQSRNFTRGMLGYDLSPAYSPDGKKLAWESMERDGYEADQNRIIVYDLEKNTRVNYSEHYDIEAQHITWGEDSESIYFIAPWFGTQEIFKLDVNGQFNQLTEGIHNYTSVIPAGETLVATKESMSMPSEIFTLTMKPGSGDKQITFVNKDLLDQLEFGKVEKRFVTTTDGKKMLTWVIYPPNFSEHKTYSALLYCQGGPQSMVGQFWSYRWNFQMMAANDYIVIAPNRRGLPGFGKEWKEQISGDYGGQNMKDYLSAVDEIKKETYVDDKLIGAVGASYGGFSVYWLAGNHDGRFAALIAHDGMFNFESQYLETEEIWFPNWDLGGPFWDSTNQVAMRSYANSPHKFVNNWKKWHTPILISHGELDYRVPVGQGIQAFQAAQLLGIPSQFLYFPNENHWVLSPQNGILWQRTFFRFLDTWLKPPPGVRN